MTSLWKTGKTTVLAGMLRCLETGEPFFGRATRPARAWVVSEESRSHWRERLALVPIGAHVQLIARPFRGRPTLDDWNELVDRAIAAKPDLFVVDPLASFLPGRCESDAASLLEALQPLLRLTAVGTEPRRLHRHRLQLPVAPLAIPARRSAGAALLRVGSRHRRLRRRPRSQVPAVRRARQDDPRNPPRPHGIVRSPQPQTRAIFSFHEMSRNSGRFTKPTKILAFRCVEYREMQLDTRTGDAYKMLRNQGFGWI